MNRTSPTQHLPLLLAAALSLTPLARATDTALVIGNGDYDANSGWGDLTGRPIDAKNVEKMLSDAGYQVVKKDDLDAAEIKKAIKENLPEDDCCYVIYYSGHGDNGVGMHGELVGVDGNLVTPKELQDCIGNHRDKTLVILDSCGSGDFANTALAEPNANNCPGFLTATSGLQGCPDGANGSPFTNEILDCVKEANVKLVTVKMVSDCLKQSYDNAQHTHYYNDKLKDKVIGQSKPAGGKGANPLAMTNGTDVFFTPSVSPGAFSGVWRCVPSDVLHSPTRVVDPFNPLVGSYASKITDLTAVVTASPNSKIRFPTIALSSGPGSCRFFLGSGQLNFGLASAAGSSFIVGPTGSGTPTLHNLITDFAIANPATAPNQIVEIALRLSCVAGSPSTIAIPEDNSVVLWMQDNDTQLGPGTRQYWTGSIDEQNLCSGFSFLLSSNGLAYKLLPNTEWSIGIGTLDATLTATIASIGPGQSGLNTHSDPNLYLTQFDQGTGAFTLSVGGPSPRLGFSTYDQSNPLLGTSRLVFANLWGLSTDGTLACDPNAGNYLTLPTGGPGGPSLTGSIAQQPRIVGRIDTTTTALLNSPVWILGTSHSTYEGANENPYYGGDFAGVSGSTGNNGGFTIPIPPLAQLVGLRLYFSSVSLNPFGTAIASTFNDGHSHSNGFPMYFAP